MDQGQPHIDHKWFRIAFDRSPLPSYILDIDGKVVAANQALAILYGLDQKGLDAVLSSYNVFDDTQVDTLGVRGFFERALAGERVVGPIERYDAQRAAAALGVTQPEARVRWVRATLFPLQEGAGPHALVMAIFEDMTEHHLQLQQYRQSRALFHSTADGMVITDLDGTITDVNPAFTAITGWKPREAIGQNPRILRSGAHDDAFYAEMWRSLAAHGIWRGEITNRRKDGTTYRERLTITTINDSDGVPEGYVGVFTQLG